MILIASFLLGLASAKTFDVYVSPIEFVNQTTSGRVSVNHDPQAPFYYTSQYARMADVPNGKGGYHDILIAYSDIRTYNTNNIEIGYDNCDYSHTPLKCSVFNNHHYVQTIVTFNDDQMIIRTTLYGKDGTVINSSSRTDEMEIRWIKQQETTVIQQSGLMGSQTITHTPKEELPLRWEIPYRLFDQHVQQAMLGLWLGVKIK